MFKKDFNDLTILDDYIFCRVMAIKPSICQRILITIIENPVGKLHIVESQKAIKSFIDSKGIRLDVYAEDAKNI